MTYLKKAGSGPLKKGKVDDLEHAENFKEATKLAFGRSRERRIS